jgi:hypothetical protein
VPEKMKMQQVKFGSVDEMLEYLPDDELLITERLRKLVFDCVPSITEKLSFNVPFYKLNKGMFFIWPSSILWGAKKTNEGVRFGFQQGYLLIDELGYLDKGGRKQVYWRDFLTVKDIDFDLLRTYIYEALIIDESFKKK